jgi:hypothetical protein
VNDAAANVLNAPLASKETRVPVSRPERETAAARNLTDAWIDAFGGVQDALEEPAALEIEQRAFELALCRGFQRA